MRAVHIGSMKGGKGGVAGSYENPRVQIRHARPVIIFHAVRNDAFNPRSKAPALERNALEAPASDENPGRQEPLEQRVPRQEPRNKDKIRTF